jgi:hypothetical protein
VTVEVGLGHAHRRLFKENLEALPLLAKRVLRPPVAQRFELLKQFFARPGLFGHSHSRSLNVVTPSSLLHGDQFATRVSLRMTMEVCLKVERSEG